ncbi:MAG: hypothetical protein AAF890_00660 [Pseudomonadota bacterium]
MMLIPSLKKIRAAYSLTAAMAGGTEPKATTLVALGMEPRMAKRFKR